MCIKLVIEISLYYDARSKKHQITEEEPVCTAKQSGGTGEHKKVL